ncbi:hypothetical protein BC629DRAFT_1597155 [Irpex lacteus]|nr:hypothetical protein BC629DRAFT_1597155 [Irpex lacteus]
MVETKGPGSPILDGAPRRHNTSSEQHSSPMRRDHTSNSRPGMLRLQSMVKTSVELDLSSLNLADPPRTPRTSRVLSTPTTPSSSRPHRTVSETPVEVSDSSPEAEFYRRSDEPVSPTKKSFRSRQSLSYRDLSSPSAVYTRDWHEDMQRVQAGQLPPPSESRLTLTPLPSPEATPPHSPDLTDNPRKSFTPLTAVDEEDWDESVYGYRFVMQEPGRWLTSPSLSTYSTPHTTKKSRAVEQRHVASHISSGTNKVSRSSHADRGPSHRTPTSNEDAMMPTDVDSRTRRTQGSSGPTFRTQGSSGRTSRTQGNTRRTSAHGSSEGSFDDIDEGHRGLGMSRSELVELYGYESDPDDGRFAKKAWYAVTRGQGVTGVFNTWERVFQLTDHVSGAHQKGYHCKEYAVNAYRNAMKHRSVRKLPGGEDHLI